MKIMIIVFMIFIMSSTLVAIDSFFYNQLDKFTYKSIDLSSDLLSIKPDGYEDLKFRLGTLQNLQGYIQENDQKNNSVLKLIVWMSYKF